MLMREGDLLVVEAHPNGRVRVPLTIWRRGTEETVLVDECNLASANDRAAFVQRLPADAQAEAARLLEAVAVEAARERDRGPDAGADQPLQGRAITLADPEPWPEPVVGAALLADLVRAIHRYVVLPPGAATAQALWVLHTHAHGASQVSPVLALISPEKRCGKTTALIVLAALVPRPLMASNITGAVLFRSVEKYRPTLLVDEADTFLGDRDELRGLLNSGHNRTGAVVLRTVGDDHEPHTFSTWCPKAIAVIGRLPATLEDRAVVIPMRRRRPDERVDRLRLDRLGGFEPLRRRACRWAQDHLNALGVADPAVPDSLGDRAADNWRPLLALADLAGGGWPERARRAALLLSGVTDEGEQAPGVQVLADLRALFAGRWAERLPTDEIVTALKGMEDRPWPEWKHGQPLTARQLARLLRPFGVQPKAMKLRGRTVRGYEVDSFQDCFARYLPPDDPQLPQLRSNTATAEGSASRNSLMPVADRVTAESPRPTSTVTVVADEDREAREERAAIMEYDGGMSRAAAERAAGLTEHDSGPTE